MKYTETPFRASVECEFNLGFAQVKDDNKNKLTLGEAKASVARNFAWALPKQKGTVK